MDDFRKNQRLQCHSGSPSKMGPYGCPCCNDYSLPVLKKVTRRRARVWFKRQTKKEILAGD